MFNKGKKSILKTILTMCLIITMIIPQVTWAVPVEGDSDTYVELAQPESVVNTQKDSRVSTPSKSKNVTTNESVTATAVESTTLNESATLNENVVPTEISPSNEEISANVTKGKWVLSARKYKFQYEDGTYATKTWEVIKDEAGVDYTYYFDASGFMVTDWQLIGTHWYYFKPNNDGSLLTGWQELEGKVYYLQETGELGDKGRMSTNWQELNDKWYYFEVRSGELITDWVELGGYWYYLKPEGELGTLGQMLVGWQKVNGFTHYLDRESGQLLHAWQEIDGYKYYFDKWGNLVTGWQKIDNKYFYLETTGAMGVIGRMQTGWKEINGKRCYLIPDSGQLATAWQVIDGQRYYFVPDGEIGTIGIMVTGWLELNKKWFYLSEGTISTNLSELQVADTMGQMQIGWLEIGGHQYYFETKDEGHQGEMQTGWLTLDGATYYLNQANRAGIEGAMCTNWQEISGSWYLFTEEGKITTNWYYAAEQDEYYYFHESSIEGVKGRMATGWNKLDNDKWYFMAETKDQGTLGTMSIGWRKIDGYWYHFTTKTDWTMGQMQAGWQKLDEKWYYFDTVLDGKSPMTTGWKTINGEEYYFRALRDGGSEGSMCIGWAEIAEKWYYFGQLGDLSIGWRQINGHWYYLYEEGKLDGNKGHMVTGWHQTGSNWYYMLPGDGRMATGRQVVGADTYYFQSSGAMLTDVTIEGVYYGKDGRAETAYGQKSIKSLLQIAIKPVGSTIYVWAGGHDYWSGGDGVRSGLNPNWKSFYNQQTEKYEHNYIYRYGVGLDCSGFVSWAMYNVIESRSNVLETGRKTTETAANIPKKYADTNKWGTVKANTSPTKFYPGDIVGTGGHVWIVLGQYDDGSVLLVHSTPQAGVQLSGTPTSAGTSNNSKAIAAAKQYMKIYRDGTEKKPNLKPEVGLQYLRNVNHFQWDVSGNKLMSDKEGIRGMTPGQVLEVLYG